MAMDQLINFTRFLIIFALISGTRIRRTGAQRDGACSFQENAEKQISVEEDTPPGTELFIVRAYPRRLFNIQAVDGVSITV